MSEFYLKVAGVTFEGRQRVIAGLKQGQALKFVPDPSNPYDSSAVKIVTADGTEVGFVSRDRNSQIFDNLMNNRGEYQVSVSSITGGGFDSNYGCNIKVIYTEGSLRKPSGNTEPLRTAVSAKEIGNKRPNLIEELDLSTKNVSAIEYELLRGGKNATVMLSEFIGKYFSDAKHNRLHSVPSFGDVLVILFSMTMGDSSSVEETVEQAALYCNLYPDAFNRLSEDLVAFFKTVNLEEPLAAIRKLAKEEDGEYEAMMRASGTLVEPF